MDRCDEISGAAVLSRLLEVYGVASEGALADVLGKARTTVNSWKVRNSIPYDECVDAANKFGVSLDWLILGKEEKKSTQSDGNRGGLDENGVRAIVSATLDWVRENDLLAGMPSADFITLALVMYRARYRDGVAVAEMQAETRDMLDALQARNERK